MTVNLTSPLSRNKKSQVTDADDLSMLDRLSRGGLPHDNALINDDDEHVITNSDDDAFINDEDEHVITVSDS